jgi:RNA polymerase sigma-70 factor
VRINAGVLSCNPQVQAWAKGNRNRLSDEPIKSMDRNYEASLHSAIVEAYDAGHETHGELGLRIGAFQAHLTAAAQKWVGPFAGRRIAISFIQALHTDDLYLSVACAAGTNPAWERFNAVYGKYINDVACAITFTRDVAKDLASGVMVDLFLPDHSGRSRIASYEGRSSLATWLRVIVSHRATNERARRCNNTEGIDVIPDMADESALHRVDASLRACLYGEMIGESLKCSCNSLTDRERLVLLLRYDEELQLGQIARVLGVHQSTVSRQIERACEKLRKEVISNLSTKYKLNDASVDECREDILENPSYSFLSLIGPTPA